MNSKKILHVDENHPLLIKGLSDFGYKNILSYHTPLDEIKKELFKYEGLIIRSRFPIDKEIINTASNLKFIARVGSGLENIDIDYANSRNISLIAAPEGNRNAVGEHAVGLLLSLLNKLRLGHSSIQKGNWLREDHRGFELEGKTLGIIGYGNTGKNFAEKLKGFNVKVIYYDIKPNLGNKHAEQVSLNELQEKAEVLSLHVPQTRFTTGMINKEFITRMRHPFWLINTSRGKAVITEDLVKGLYSKKILGAGLDVLEYESSSFQSIFKNKKRPKAFDYLLNAENVILSPHVAGWTAESHVKLAKIILHKIKTL